MDSEPTETTARIGVFSDRVFGVAITLLAFNLKVPELKTVANLNLLKALAECWPDYLGLINSFASVLLLWVNHHQIFKQVYHVNVALMLANGLVLLLIIGVPFPTATMSRYLLTAAGPYAAACYAGYFVLVNIAFRLLWHVVAHQRALLKPTVSAHTIKTFRRTMAVGAPLYLALLALLSPVSAVLLSPVSAVLLCNASWVHWTVTLVKIHRSHS